MTMGDGGRVGRRWCGTVRCGRPPVARLTLRRAAICNNVRPARWICYILIQVSEPLDTAELLAFCTTVDAKSLSRAAAELGVPRATLSRRLARLEHRLGVRLLRRSTRSMVLSDAGELLYRHARIVLDAAREAEASVRRRDDVVRGDLRVSLPQMTNPELLDVFAEFAAAHPEVRLQVQFTSRLIDLRRDGYDVALRATSQIEPGLVARTLMRASLIAVASPAYLAARGTPVRLGDLRDHRCLMGFARGELPQTHWTAAGRKVQVDGACFSNEPRLLCRLAVRGQGIAFVPAAVAAGPLARGELVAVMPKVLRSEGRIALVYLERELMPPQVRAFVDWMVARAPAALLPAPAPASPVRARARR